MNDEIIQLLENSKLRQKVIETIQSVWSYAGTLYDNPDEDMEKYVEENKEASLWEEAWWRAETFGHIGKIEQAFDEYVIQKMAKPYRLTLEELVEVFFDLAKPDERHYTEFEGFSSDDCNNLYAIFVNYVKNHILSYRHSNPFPICAITSDAESERYIRGMMAGYQIAMSKVEGKPFESKNSDEKFVEDERPLWDKNSISLRLLRGTEVIDARPAGKELYHILGLIEGNTSTLACRNLQAEMSRILPTAIRSTDLLQTTGFGNGKIIDNIGQGSFLISQREIEGLPWGDGRLLENAKPLIRQYLDAYYSDSSGKKDSIDRRISNAVHLLIESDNQPNNAVGLALSIAAIEALIGEKGPEVTVKLADNVAALLEPDTSQRYNATEFVKNLYDTRSRALHGELVETESKARIDARHLAAAVLSGVISRRDFLRRSGYEPETPQDLLKDLRESRFTTGQPMGVPEFNVRELWRNRTSGKKDSIL
jgi:hypothetical protein